MDGRLELLAAAAPVAGASTQAAETVSSRRWKGAGKFLGGTAAVAIAGPILDQLFFPLDILGTVATVGGVVAAINGWFEMVSGKPHTFFPQPKQ